MTEELQVQPLTFPLSLDDSLFMGGLLLFSRTLSFRKLSGAIQSIFRTSSISTISTPSSGSEYVSVSTSTSFLPESDDSRLSVGAVERVRPSPREGCTDPPEAGPRDGPEEKFERGTARLAAAEPDIVGPSARGPVATIS